MILIKITKLRGAKVDAGLIGEKPGIVVRIATAKKYTLLIRMNCTKIALGKNDNLA